MDEYEHLNHHLSRVKRDHGNWHTLYLSLGAAMTLFLTLSACTRQGAPELMRPDQSFRYDGKCVTITGRSEDQVEYVYKKVVRQDNSTSTLVESGRVPESAMGRRCSPVTAEKEGKRSAGAMEKALFEEQNNASLAAKDRSRVHRGSLAPPEIREMVQAHNRVRSELGIGPMTWSGKLASYAQRWARRLAAGGRCRLEHRPANRYGENLAFWGGTGALQASVVRAVEQWKTEKRLWNRSKIFSGASLPAGHYTQIIWRKSTQVGCGRATCGNGVVVVCNYYPAGNVVGMPIY